MLLNLYNNHYTEIHFIFSIFMSMSRSMSVYSYLCDLLFIFSLIFIAIDHITSFGQTYLVFCIFFRYLLLFLDNNMDEESE